MVAGVNLLCPAPAERTVFMSSSFTHWLRSLRSKSNPTKSASRRRHPRRLLLERLEDRTVPSVLTLSGALPADTVNVAYHQTIAASGGTGTVTLTVSNVQNPIAGLHVPGSGKGSLTITGAPITLGAETFTVTASDGAGDVAAMTYAITVNHAVTLSPATLPADTVNVPYSQTITAGVAENTFYANQVVSYVPGTIPDSGYNNPSAALGGLNPVTGTFGGSNFYLTPFDPAFEPSDLVEIGAGGSLVLKLADTAATTGYTIGVHTGFGLLDLNYPSGTNANPASYLNSALRQADVQVSADGVHWGNLGTITFENPSNIDTGAATDPEGFAPGVGPAADPGKSFLGNLNSFNGQDWQGTLKTLNGSAGGTWLNLKGVKDEQGNLIGGVNYIKFVVPSSPPLDPHTGNPEIMVVDAVVGTSGTPSGGTGAITLGVSSIQNPILGLTVQSNGTGTLQIAGTPTAAGTEKITVTATDSVGGKTTKSYSITVTPPLVIQPGNLPTATVGDSFRLQFNATGGSGKGFVFTASGLPSGLTLASDGLLTGTPRTAGDAPFQLTVTDSDGISRTLNYDLSIDPTLGLHPGSPLPAATVGDKFRLQLNATGGSGTGYNFTATGLPTWLTLSSDGLLVGTPTTDSDTLLHFKVTVTDSDGGWARYTYYLRVG
jgi:hypothetical protein